MVAVDFSQRYLVRVHSSRSDVCHWAFRKCHSATTNWLPGTVGRNPAIVPLGRQSLRHWQPYPGKRLSFRTQLQRIPANAGNGQGSKPSAAEPQPNGV
jgi:hypothetical protein